MAIKAACDQYSINLLVRDGVIVLHNTAAGGSVAPLLCILCIPPVADMCWMWLVSRWWDATLRRWNKVTCDSYNSASCCSSLGHIISLAFVCLCFSIRSFLDTASHSSLHFCIHPVKVSWRHWHWKDGNSAINIKWCCHHPPHNHIRSSSRIRILWSVKWHGNKMWGPSHDWSLRGVDIISVNGCCLH